MANLLNKIFSKIERCLSVRWYNPIYSLYFNLRCLPFTQAVRLPIAIYGRPKFIELRGNIQFTCKIKSSLVKINSSHTDAPSYQGCHSEILLRGLIIFHGRGQIDTGTKIYVGANATLELGDSFKICDFVNIGCTKKISIGSISRITHRCQVFDTNYHFLANLNKRIIPPAIKPVFIGNNVWVGNTSTICGGANIPDTTIVASNSLVNKDYSVIPRFSLIGGIPAKLIASGFRRIESQEFTMELYNYYNNTDELFHIPDNIRENVFIDE